MKASVIERGAGLLDWLFSDDEREEQAGLNAPPPDTGGAFVRENTLESRREDRDRKAQNVGSGTPAEKVSEFVRATGLEALVKREFQRLISEEHRVLAQSGSAVDVPNAIRRFAGDHAVDELYERHETRATGDRAVGVALDMSGSMRTDERTAKAALTAFARAVETIGDTFVAAGFSGSSSRLITGPSERFQAWHLDAVQAGGGTPTAAGVDDVLNLLAATQASEQLLVVVTDGMPGTMLEHNAFETAEEEVEALVGQARDRGVDVIGVGIGSVKHQRMATMFGDNSYTKTGVHRLDEELVSAYRAQTAAPGGIV